MSDIQINSHFPFYDELNYTNSEYTLVRSSNDELEAVFWEVPDNNDFPRDNDHLFLKACFKGHLEAVKYIIDLPEDNEYYIDINIVNDGFQRACFQNNLSIVKKLLELNDNRKVLPYYVYVSFFDACRISNLDIMQFLLTLTDERRITNKIINHSNCLETVCYRGNLKVLIKLLNIKSNTLDTRYVSWIKCVEIAKYLDNTCNCNLFTKQTIFKNKKTLDSLIKYIISQYNINDEIMINLLSSQNYEWIIKKIKK